MITNDITQQRKCIKSNLGNPNSGAPGNQRYFNHTNLELSHLVGLIF